MTWIRPHHTRWLIACTLGLLLSVWAAGWSWSVVVMFGAIFGAGVALIGRDTGNALNVMPSVMPSAIESPGEHSGGAAPDAFLD